MVDDADPSVRGALGSRHQRADAGLARDLSDLARRLQADTSMDALLARITRAAVDEVDGAQHAGISEMVSKQVRSRAATSDLVTVVDGLQDKVQDGPCLTSLRRQLTVRSNDLRAETRWPRFSTAAAQQGVLSMLSVQLFVEDDNLGALNLFAQTADAFSDADESTAILLASHAAIAMKGSRVESNLRVALQSRDVIGQAKGILMERYRVDAMQAFDLLVMASQRTNMRLSRLAEHLATTGELRVAQ